ncbi:hypothetical protein DERP_007698 [Dermatophagoides pteronyssinus]|uniref:Uncharacterized protein n=1 Tax=Dermatophagoides pteronyssinus TaxID=6956 RepID=A0ABQ8JKM1_DERPT|nr:hypothetical protein DERP_007698 [Dermatophagoides pteronyssinus]
MNLVSLHGSMNVLSCGLWRHAHAELTKKPAKIVVYPLTEIMLSKELRMSWLYSNIRPDGIVACSNL